MHKKGLLFLKALTFHKVFIFNIPCLIRNIKDDKTSAPKSKVVIPIIKPPLIKKEGILVDNQDPFKLQRERVLVKSD